MWRSALLVVMVCVPANGFAWRQTQTCLQEDPPAPTGTEYCVGNELARGMHWPTPEVHYTVNQAGSHDFPTDDGLIAPELLAVIQASFDTWNAPDCSDFEFVYDGLSSEREFDNEDGLNLVVFQDESWPYGSTWLAVTSVTATIAGTITNADLELNGANQRFGIVTAPGEAVWDVQNTVTHEAGHMLGLDHDAVPDSTMEFEAAPGETTKRDLHPDDIDGLCSIYPAGDSFEPTDPPTDEGCCSTLRGAHHRPSPWLALAVLALVFRRRFAG